MVYMHNFNYAITVSKTVRLWQYKNTETKVTAPTAIYNQEIDKAPYTGWPLTRPYEIQWDTPTSSIHRYMIQHCCHQLCRHCGQISVDIWITVSVILQIRYEFLFVVLYWNFWANRDEWMNEWMSDSHKSMVQLQETDYNFSCQLWHSLTFPGQWSPCI